MATAFNTSDHTVSVHSAFDLPPAQKKAIEAAVKETFAQTARVQFETAPALVSGIELSTNGHKVAWNIADYLATLEKTAGELLNKDAKPEPKPDAKQRAKGQAKPAARLKRSPSQSVKPKTGLYRCHRPQRRTIEYLDGQPAQYLRPCVRGDQPHAGSLRTAIDTA